MSFVPVVDRARSESAMSRVVLWLMSRMVWNPGADDAFNG
jgi:hypothetical protein